MPITTIDNIKGNEIPPNWLKKAKINSEGVFRITIEKRESKCLVSSQKKKTNGKKWKRVAERLQKEGFLTNKSKEANKLINEFRDQFEIRS